MLQLRCSSSPIEDLILLEFKEMHDFVYFVGLMLYNKIVNELSLNFMQDSINIYETLDCTKYFIIIFIILNY